MAGNRNLTLSGLLLSYALLLGLGWLVAGSLGMWVAGAIVTVLWVWAIARASRPTPP